LRETRLNGNYKYFPGGRYLNTIHFLTFNKEYYNILDTNVAKNKAIAMKGDELFSATMKN
jgi:hypothetical protein